jgi:hypothetical protein
VVSPPRRSGRSPVSGNGRCRTGPPGPQSQPGRPAIVWSTSTTSFGSCSRSTAPTASRSGYTLATPSLPVSDLLVEGDFQPVVDAVDRLQVGAT